MKLENRYLVLKRADIDKYLTQEAKEEIENIVMALSIAKQPDFDTGVNAEVSCVVIESHWPEYEPTLKLLSDRVGGTENSIGNDLCNELIRIAGALGLDPEFFDTESSQQHCMLEMARAAADKLEQAQ